MSSLRGFLALMRGSLMVGFIYRFGFLFTILGNIVYMAVAYYLWRSIYGSSETLRGLTFEETYLYVSMGSVVFILLKTYADQIIGYEIREGLIAVYLTKPMDYQWFSLAVSIGGALMNLAAVTLPTILMIVMVFRIPIQPGPGLLLFPFSLAAAFLISFNFDYMVGVLAFYSESNWGLSTTKEIIIALLSGALIPLQFFPDAIRAVLLNLPFQSIYFTPLMMVARPGQSWEALLGMLGVQLFWAVVTYILSRLLYNQAVKVLRVAGG